MLVWISKATYRTAIALAVVIALALSNLGTALSIHPTEAAFAEAMKPGDGSVKFEHSHHNANENGGSQIPDHQHSHDASDHSHITAGTPPAIISVLGFHEPKWHAQTACLAAARLCVNLERPPKASFIA